MNTSLSSNKIRPNQVLGGMGWLDEIGSEMEIPLSSVAKGFGGIMGDIMSMGEDLTEGGSPEKTDSSKLQIGGQTEIDFNQRQSEAEAKLKEKEQSDKKRAFYQILKEDQDRAQRAKEKLLFEEEIYDLTANLPTDEKNRLLHYQASYKDMSIYQRAELRKKIIEQRRKTEKQEKSASIPSPAKQASALESAFEGGSGKQGSGTANLSAQATG